MTLHSMVRQVGALILLLGLACVPPYGQELALGLLIVVAWRDTASTLKSLVAGTMIEFMNPMLASGGEGNVAVTVLKWSLLFMALARSLMSRVEPTTAYKNLIVCWWAITAVLLANSFFISLFPDISVFKAISFSLGLLCILRLGMMNLKSNTELLLFVSEMGAAVFFTSLPLLPLAIGHSVNESGFNGVLRHPQALGILLVMTGAAALAAALKIPGLRGILTVLALSEWSLVYFTKSRTALIAICFGGVVYLGEVIIRNGKGTRIRYFLNPGTVTAFLGFTLFIMLSAGVRQGFASFLQKGHQESFGSLNDAEFTLQTSSRGNQIFDGLELARQHPLLGAGFGVDEDSGLREERNDSKFLGIPLTAPVEQGFLPIATIAQIGVVGSLFTLTLLWSTYRMARNDSGESAALFAAVLGVNCGEMIFYSIGGLGSLMWVMLLLLAAGGVAVRQPVPDGFR